MRSRLAIFIRVFCITVLMVPVGTITHELGHYLFAKSINVDAIIKYNITELPKYREITSLVDNEVDNKLKSCSDKEILKNIYLDWFNLSSLLSVETKKQYLDYLAILKFVTIGGPISTISIGTISFIFLIKRNKERIIINTKNLVLIFLSLFWLREIFGLLQVILSKDLNLLYTDEVILARLFNIPTLLIINFLSLIGIGVIIKILILIESEYRFMFISCILLGSFIGYCLWFNILGPILLP